jgi:polyhydroxybutyrate depolymerase
MIRTQVAFVIFVVAVLTIFGAALLAGDELPADRISVADVLADPSAEEQAARAAMLEAVNARRQQLEQQIRQNQGRERRASLPGMGELEMPEHLERREIEAGGRTREYFLFVPDSVKGRPVPVVFALHGGAANSGLQMHYKADYTVVGEREGFVAVYPSGVRGWNWDPSQADQRYSAPRVAEVDDFVFYEAMLDGLIEEGIADPKRVYITGGSNGGMMSFSLAHQLSDRIAGVGIMVATMPEAAVTWPRPSHAMPIIVMIGTLDPIMSWEGGEGRLSTQETVSYWLGFNRCVNDGAARALPDTDPDDGTRVFAARWEGDAPVVLYRMQGHGHGWPGTRANATGPKTQDISAPEEFWSFLKDHRLPE